MSTSRLGRWPRAAATAGLLIVIAGIALIVALVLLRDDSDDTSSDAAESNLTTTLIEQRDLTEYLEIDGTLDYEGTVTLAARSDGSLIHLAAEGTVVGRGESIYLILDPPTEAETAAALAEVASAQDSLMVAEDDLSSARAGPSDADIAAERAAVATAIEARDELIAAPTVSEIRTAEAAVAVAAEALEQLDNPTDAARAQSRSDLAAAQEHLAQLTAGATQAEIESAKANLVTAQEALAELLAEPSEAEIESAEAAVAIAWERLREELQCCSTDAEIDQLRAVLLTAEEALDELLAGPTEAEVDEAEADVLAAQEALDDLTAGASGAEIEDAEADVLAAKEALDLLDNPTEAARAQARADVATASQSLADLRAGPSDAQIDAANAAILVAEEALADLLAPSSETELATLTAAVQSAEAALDAAEEQWADLGHSQHSLILLYGSMPAYRTMEPGTSGDDVRQLQENLVELGYLDREQRVADGVFDEATATAVQRWQQEVGHRVDATVGTADVLFVDGPVQIGPWSAGIEVGQDLPAGTTLASLTVIETPTGGVMATTQRVAANLPLGDRDLVSEEIIVNVELPDGTDVEGTVIAINPSPVADSATGENVVELTIQLHSPASAVWIGASVVVEITETLIADALVVPATALVALVEGGSAVEVLADDGSTRLIGVETGLFVDGDVEVLSPDLRAGMRVVVPR